MRALLLAAGFGTRLRPVTDKVPKCLVTIRGKPLLQYWLDALFAAGAERVLVNTHYLSEAIRAFLMTCPARDKVDLAFEPELLGTGGTIAANAAFFAGEAGLVLHADNLSDMNLMDLVGAHRRRPPQCAMTMATFDTDQPQSCGIVECDEQDIVIAFHEKVSRPPGIRANAAAYVMEPEVIRLCEDRFDRFLDLSTAVIPQYLGRILAYHHGGYHRDIGSLDSLRQARADFCDPQPV
jgi:mannose-1-phosphate guanylyltransferase